jgi:predicted phospho-2-dehydro-3-deoxyheptonate aldolase
MSGKKRRLNRIMKKGRTLIVPMDHGITSPISGIENPDRVIERIRNHVNAIILHKGTIKHSRLVDSFDGGLIAHLSASTTLGNAEDKRVVSSVENAIKLGADAVSLHINVGSSTEGEQLEVLGRISEICDSWEMPLLAMMYPRGKGIDERNPVNVKHAVRIGYEMGADIIKTNYTGSVDTFIEVVEVSSVPVIIAGGSKTSDITLLREVKEAIIAGAAGAAVGRNVFQHSRPDLVVKSLAKIIHEDFEVEEAGEILYERDMVANRGHRLE